MPESILDAARRYVGWGLSVIPLEAGTKEPAILKWKPYQRRLPTDAELVRWFKGTDNQIGIICGSVSRDTAVRDFDTLARYLAWVDAHPDEAIRLPTALTGRGAHVYGRCRGARTQDLPDGELRAEGAYVQAPPSVHSNGTVYTWQIPLDGEVPEVDVVAVFGARPPDEPPAEGGDFDDEEFRPSNRCDDDHDSGFSASRDYSQNSGQEEGTSTDTTEKDREDRAYRADRDGLSTLGTLCTLSGHASLSSHGLSRAVVQTILRCVEQHLPLGNSSLDAAAFRLARALKAVPEARDRGFRELIPCVREWYERARGRLGAAGLSDVLAAFARAWERVRLPLGEGLLDEVMERALKAPIPDAVADLGDNAILLAQACTELQDEVGDRAFWLSCRDAGRLLEIDYKRANDLLHLLVKVGFLKVVTKGTKTKATRFRVCDDGACGREADQDATEHEEGR